MQSPGHLLIGRFESADEFRAYQTQLRAIRSRHGGSPRAAKLIQLLNAKTRSRQKDRPAYIASMMHDSLIKTGRASSETVITYAQMQPKVIGVSLKGKDKHSPRTKRTQSIYQVIKYRNRVRLILSNLVEPIEVVRWMSAPNPALDNYSPTEAIEIGHGDRVVELLLSVAEGIYV